MIRKCHEVFQHVGKMGMASLKVSRIADLPSITWPKGKELSLLLPVSEYKESISISKWTLTFNQHKQLLSFFLVCIGLIISPITLSGLEKDPSDFAVPNYSVFVMLCRDILLAVLLGRTFVLGWSSNPNSTVPTCYGDKCHSTTPLPPTTTPTPPCGDKCHSTTPIPPTTTTPSCGGDKCHSTTPIPPTTTTPPCGDKCHSTTPIPPTTTTPPPCGDKCSPTTTPPTTPPCGDKCHSTTPTPTHSTHCGDSCGGVW